MTLNWPHLQVEPAAHAGKGVNKLAMLPCREKRKKYTLFLCVATIHWFRLCGSSPPSPITERGRAEGDVPKRKLLELLVQGRKVHDDAKNDYNQFGSETEESAQSKFNEAVTRERLSGTWTKGQAAQDGYQNDFPGFSGVAGKVLVPSSEADPRASEWLAMRPVLLCDHNFMTFTASGPGFSQLLVDKGGASPVSPFQLALYCGYSVRRWWGGLLMVVPYDACYVTQENGSYVLPVLWWGSPLKLACPAQTPTAAPLAPVVLCSHSGMTVHLGQRDNALPVLGVLVNQVWAAFVSARCAYRVDSQPDDFVFFIPFTAPCLTAGLELHLVFPKQEMIFSCPFPPATSSSPRASSAPHHSSLSTPPPPPSPAQESIDGVPNQRHATDTDLPYPEIPQPSAADLQPDITPWFSPTSGPEALRPQFSYPSNTVPVAPGSSTQDPIAQLPDHPRHSYPGFLSPTFPQVYPSGSESTSLSHIPRDPGAQLHQFQYPQNPLGPPPPASPTQDQMPQYPDHFHWAFPGFVSPHFPQVYAPPSDPGGPPQPADPHRSTSLDYLQIPSYPLPPEATLTPGPLPPASGPPRPHDRPPSNLYGFYNPYGPFFYPKKDLLAPSTWAYAFPQDPVDFLSPPSEQRQQANCHPSSHPLCGSYAYRYPYSHPPYPPIHAPVPQYTTESPKPTQKPALGKTSVSPPLIPKPKVFCSSNQMLLQLPPGPISGIVFKDAKGNEISAQDAPKHCGYSASIAKDGKIHFSLQLHTRCQMIVQDNMYVIGVTYTTESGRMEAQFYCPVSTSASAHGADCNLPGEQQLPCGRDRVAQASCLSLGCCFSKHPPACYYPMDECTVDRHFVFSVPASLTEPPLSPGLLGVANNATCKPVKVTYDYALFKLPMDGCGARRMEVGKTLIYMVEVVNTVQTISLNYGTITRDSPFRLLVECRYVPGSALTVSYLVKTPTVGPAVHTQGAFGVQLRLAKDAQYTSYYPQYHRPLRTLLGKPLYLEVRLLNAPDPGLKLLVHYCVAYSRTGSSLWVLLYNGCPNPLDPSSQVVPSDAQLSSPPGQTRRFTMSTFQFLPEGEIKDPNEEIYFMCSTEVCSSRDGPCVEGCFGH
ncbi:uncharacterized protein LOC133506600 isoform X2 [Syngnathoides biaculeatus]|uniref:uncharacterized protein LOC133506600 isoform X2 n=1 Tax=Syngnathoides biaculeatus TaxID=300417 RepID=UPI002ADE0F90|nr:uncharacterized protein LOC133506600 isoform X2 [Syngnathoides biaculeatus]